jgi:hypothetical protein
MYQGVGDLKALILQLNSTQQAALLDRLFSVARDQTPDVDLSAPVIKIVWILLAMSTIVVTTRLVIKFRTTRRLYLDDGLMALALVSRMKCLDSDSCNNQFSSSLLGSTPPFYKSHSPTASAGMFTIWSLTRDISHSSMDSSLWSGVIFALCLAA